VHNLINNTFASVRDLTKGNEYKVILMFTLPMLFGNVFHQLYNIIDSIVVGQYIGKEALAAVGASFPIIFFLISLVIGFSTGSTILISQYYGAKQFDNIRKVVDTNNIIMFVTAIVLGALGMIFSRDIFILIDLPKDVIPDATKFLQIYFLGMPAFFGFQGISAILRGVGDSKTPLYFLIISTSANLILDLILIVWLKFGIEGVAYATLVSQIGAFATVIYWVNKKHKELSFRVIKLKFDREVFYKSLKIGIPSGFQMMIVSLSMMAIFAIVNKFGTDVVAAYSGALRIDSLATLPAMMFSTALSAFVGQNIGAKRYDRVKKGFFATLIMSAIFSIIITIVIIIFGESLMNMFIDDANIVRIGEGYLVIISSFYILFAIMFTSNAVMRGAGDTIIPMFITLVALWFVRIPAAHFLGNIWGEIGVWWSMPIAWAVGTILSLIYYSTGIWKKKSVVKY
jgi:putative MATE family efflux protein